MHIGLYYTCIYQIALRKSVFFQLFFLLNFIMQMQKNYNFPTPAY